MEPKVVSSSREHGHPTLTYIVCSQCSLGHFGKLDFHEVINKL